MRPLVLSLVVLLTLAATSHAGAGRAIPNPNPGIPTSIQKLPTGDDPPSGGSFGGDSDNLPVNCGHPPEYYEAWARTMPGVQQAMAVFAARGYTPISVADTALACGTNGTTLVVLAYSRPGLFSTDSTKIAFPQIVITTHLSSDNVAVTNINAGVLLLDATTHTFQNAGDYNPADASFTEVPSGGGGGGPRHYTTNDDMAAFNRWIHCTGVNGMTCIATVYLFGGAGFEKWKVALILEFPEIAAEVIGVCTMLAAFGCMGS